jgi:hypothetical protein
MSDIGKELLLTSLSDFYINKNNEHYLIVLKSIIDSKFELSLRMIDWLVTHYSKMNNVMYWICYNNDEIYNNFPSDAENCDKYKKVNLYLDYRAHLKSYTKFNFDSFRRHDRITFILDKEKSIIVETTLGQLNFFRWAFSNRIIEYALQNQVKIYENMSKYSYKKQNKKQIKQKNSLVPKQDIIVSKCYLCFD